MAVISFKPKQVAKRLLSVLPERALDVLCSRYGLGDTPDRETLEAIGKRYGITRERVRQIENFAIQSIKKSDVFKKEKGTFDELHKTIDSLGAVLPERHLLEQFSNDRSTQNHIYLFLVLGDPFNRKKEDEEFGHRWSVDEELASKVYSALKKLSSGLKDSDLIPEPEILSAFIMHLKDCPDRYKDEEILRRWLGLSKNIGRNQFGEWGRADSSNIRTRGMRDFAYLVIRKHGSPMHFKEVAEAISKYFKKEAHVATCHNELIKDPRFILVGRGLYALSEWGYTKGIVRDVIREILKKEGPLSREDIIDRVLKERYVKENTIAVNLQNGRYFKKNKGNFYSVA